MLIHVLPVNDIKSHAQSTNCDCRPRIEEQPSGDFVVVHNSWDGRELYEEDA